MSRFVYIFDKDDYIVFRVFRSHYKREIVKIESETQDEDERANLLAEFVRKKGVVVQKIEIVIKTH